MHETPWLVDEAGSLTFPIQPRAPSMDEIRHSHCRWCRKNERFRSRTKAIVQQNLEDHHLALADATGPECSIWPFVGCRQNQPCCSSIQYVYAHGNACGMDGPHDGNWLNQAALILLTRGSHLKGTAFSLGRSSMQRIRMQSWRWSELIWKISIKQSSNKSAEKQWLDK